MQDRDVPGSPIIGRRAWTRLRGDEITAIQDAKVAAVVPFLFENSGFYRHRFERLGLIPDDIKCVADLIAKWPVVEKTEMAIDAAEHPLYGTYTTIDDTIWAERGWMMFASSGYCWRVFSVTATWTVRWGPGPTPARSIRWTFGTARRSS